VGIRVRYIHSDIETIERVDIIRDLRRGEFDVLVGINLLREGLDLPEVSLVAILDADKEGFLRSEGSLIQTIGRAARNVNGQVIMYADKMTDSMQRAIDETNRRRAKQVTYNREHNIKPAPFAAQPPFLGRAGAGRQQRRPPLAARYAAGAGGRAYPRAHRRFAAGLARPDDRATERLPCRPPHAARLFAPGRAADYGPAS